MERDLVCRSHVRMLNGRSQKKFLSKLAIAWRSQELIQLKEVQVPLSSWELVGVSQAVQQDTTSWSAFVLPKYSMQQKTIIRRPLMLPTFNDFSSIMPNTAWWTFAGETGFSEHVDQTSSIRWSSVKGSPLCHKPHWNIHELTLSLWCPSGSSACCWGCAWGYSALELSSASFRQRERYFL